MQSALDELIDVILARGMQIDPGGIAHKHNEATHGTPRSPIKFNLCTSEFRSAGKMTMADMRLMARVMGESIVLSNLAVPGLAGVPRVGLGLARLLQEYLAHQTGRWIPLITAEKNELPDGTRSIGEVAKSLAYLEGPLLLIDDLVNWGFSKLEALTAYSGAGYPVNDLAVLLDYEVGAVEMLEKKGVRVRTILRLEDVLVRGLQTGKLEATVVEATREYVLDSRIQMTSHQ